MVRHCRTVLRNLVKDRFASIPNGARLGGGSVAKIRGMRLKLEGMRPGTPDLIFWREDGRVLWLEVKTPQGTVSKVQHQTHIQLIEDGHAVRIARSVAELHEDLIEFYN